MSDGHTAISNAKINNASSGFFQSVLSYLSNSNGTVDIVIHVTSNQIYSYGLAEI
jgi:hypothetical protein